MSLALAEFADKLVSVSDFSQGKAGKIFSEVAEFNKEYIVLKNNQPIAVVVSIESYKETQQKVARLEAMLEKLENIRLLQIADERKNAPTKDFDKFVTEEGFSKEELEKLAECVEIE